MCAPVLRSLLLACALAACAPQPSSTASSTSSSTSTASSTATSTATATTSAAPPANSSASASLSPAATIAPTPAQSRTPSSTPTFGWANATARAAVRCFDNVSVAAVGAGAGGGLAPAFTLVPTGLCNTTAGAGHTIPSGSIMDVLVQPYALACMAVVVAFVAALVYRSSAARVKAAEKIVQQIQLEARAEELRAAARKRRDAEVAEKAAALAKAGSAVAAALRDADEERLARASSDMRVDELAPRVPLRLLPDSHVAASNRCLARESGRQVTRLAPDLAVLSTNYTVSGADGAEGDAGHARTIRSSRESAMTIASGDGVTALALLREGGGGKTRAAAPHSRMADVMTRTIDVSAVNDELVTAEANKAKEEEERVEKEAAEKRRLAEREARRVARAAGQLQQHAAE
jgi:hypothetical protein